MLSYVHIIVVDFDFFEKFMVDEGLNSFYEELPFPFTHSYLIFV